MWELVVHDKDEAPMLVTGGRLPSDRVVEAGVVPFAATLLRNNDGCLPLGHVWRMDSNDVSMAGMADLVG
jgi:hypothetical protein